MLGLTSGLILTLTFSAQPRGQGDRAFFPEIIIIPQRWPCHLPIKPRAIRACSSSPIKSHLNEGNALSGVGAPQPHAGLLYDKTPEPFMISCTAAIQLLQYKCLSRTLNCNPCSYRQIMILQPDCCGLKANGNYQFAGKPGRANIAVGWRKDAGLGVCKGMV